jgi:membrane-bound lytic murein transglycosylase C
MMKKFLALALVAPLLVSCSSKNKGDSFFIGARKVI